MGHMKLGRAGSLDLALNGWWPRHQPVIVGLGTGRLPNTLGKASQRETQRELIFSYAWNLSTGERLEANGWGPTLDRSGFNV